MSSNLTPIEGPAWRLPGLVVLRAVQNFIADMVPRLGASLSYYAMFSLAPLMVVTLLIASFAFDSEEVRVFVMTALSDTIGLEAARALERVMDGQRLRETGGWGSSAIALGVTLAGASFVVAELKAALDDIFGARAAAVQPPWYTLVTVRIRAMSIVLVLAVLMLVSLVISTVLSAITARWGQMLPGWAALLQLADVLIGLALAAALFYFLYRFFPQNPPSRRSALIGALVASVLFGLGRHFIALYLGIAGTASAWGAAGSLAAILVWVYFSSQIMLFGAEVAKATGCVRLPPPDRDSRWSAAPR
ncbi:MAG TPA: YihY/virulence factor BrkB family protein [Burkholderiaceae bacterium]|nr:YihY/virulence factor BrkB family protein [Burkholderiaceae bacterium]